MGMFDTITLYTPTLGCRVGCYQSKDLACELDEYIIRDGRLVCVQVHGPDRPLGDVEFNGMLNIFAFDPFSNPDWLEYNLSFKDGTLIGCAEV